MKVPCVNCITLAACQRKYHESINSTFWTDVTLYLAQIGAMSKMSEDCPYLKAYIGKHVIYKNNLGYEVMNAAKGQEFDDFINKK